MDQDASDRREGRGRLSSIDTLPEEADEDVAWANAALTAREMPQTEILRELNARLADKGIGSISKGAFSRWSVRKAVALRKIDAARQMQDAVLGRLSPEERNDGTLVLTEMIKSQILELVAGQEAPDPAILGFASLTLQRLSLSAARANSEQRVDRKDKAVEAERKKAERAAKKATEDMASDVEKIATEAGLGADRIEAIKRGVLGIGG